MSRRLEVPMTTEFKPLGKIEAADIGVRWCRMEITERGTMLISGPNGAKIDLCSPHVVRELADWMLRAIGDRA